MAQPSMHMPAITPLRFTPPPKSFPCFLNKLSTDLTSLNFDEERLSIVVEMVINADGTLQDSDIYRARVINHAKLAYQ